MSILGRMLTRHVIYEALWVLGGAVTFWVVVHRVRDFELHLFTLHILFSDIGNCVDHINNYG